jgi:very-short-patch-repair endonuclease
MNADDGSPCERGRRLRAESTTAEQKLWRHLRAKRLGGFKFRRQHRIGPYFADFCCIQQRLIIELDGGQHATQEEERRDATRTAYLREQGFRVIRFWNEQVNRETNAVLEAIYAALTDS